MPIILKHIKLIKPKQFLYEAPPKWLLEKSKGSINFKRRNGLKKQHLEISDEANQKSLRRTRP